MSTVWRTSSTVGPTAAASNVIYAMQWGNERALATSHTAENEQKCRQIAQNCPRSDNRGIMWRFYQRSSNGFAASIQPPRTRMRKFFDLRRMDKSYTPYGNVFGSSLVPLTNGRIGRAAGQTAWCLDAPPGSAYPTDEVYLTLSCSAQDQYPSVPDNVMPITTCDLTITYYVMFYDVAYQAAGDP